MFSTIIAVIIALLIHYSDIGNEQLANVNTLGILLITVATLFLFIPAITLSLTWTPLQKSEQNLTPRVSELFRKDFIIRITNFWMQFFPFASYIIGIDILFLKVLNNNMLLPIWIVLLGITLDALHIFLKRISKYLDPFFIVSYFSNEAHKSIQNDREIELCEWVDSLSEIAIKAIQRTNLSLCYDVEDELQKVISSFLISSKSLTHHAQDKESSALGISDKVSFTLFFALQRLEMINDKASEKKLEPICSKLVTVYSKITLAAAEYDISMPSYSLDFFGRSTLTAQQHGLKEVAAKAICALLQVASDILSKVDVTYLELQNPYLTLITQMQLISKQMFRNDKLMNLKILMQPFQDLKALFKTEKMINHPDTPVILQAIDQALAEFEALEAIMRTIPPIPTPEST